MKEKGIVFGNGFLGKRVADELNFFLSDFNIIPGDDDNRKKLKELLDKEKPSVLVNAIGKTDYKWCENNKEQAENSNVNVPMQLADYCSERGIYFIHFGTGSIYEYCYGKEYTEEDKPNFIENIYTKTKIKAEKKLKEKSEQNSNSKILQIRIVYPIDYTKNDKNLLTKILNYKTVFNLKHSITVVPDMLNALKALIEKRSLGIYNIVNRGIISISDILEIYNIIPDKENKFSNDTNLISGSHKGNKFFNDTHHYNYSHKGSVLAKKLEFEVLNLDEFEKSNSRKRSLCILSTKKLMDDGIEMPEVYGSVENCLIKYRENLQKF